MGQALYPDARRLVVTADAGGSSGYRVRLWKSELQKLADETGLEIALCHFRPARPGGTRSSTACSAPSP